LEEIISLSIAAGHGRMFWKLASTIRMLPRNNIREKVGLIHVNRSGFRKIRSTIEHLEINLIQKHL